MKKSIIAIACVAVAGVVGAPYITGSIAESETRKIVEEFNAKSDEYGVTKIVSYDRGFGSSTVAYEYNFPQSLSALTGFEDTIKYNCEYSHGMTGIDYTCDLKANEAYKSFIDTELDGVDPVSITGGLSAFGGFTQKIATTAIDKKMDDGSVLKLQPSEIIVESDSGFTVYDSVAKLGAFELSDENGSFSMSPSTMDWTVKPTDLGLFEGDYSMSIDSINFVDANQRTKLDGMEISGSSIERGDKMDSIVKLQLKSMSGEGSQAMSIEDATFTADILGVNSQALVEYQEFAASIQNDLLSSLEEGNEQQVDPNQMMAMLPIIEKMLDKDLNIKMALAGDLMGKPNSMDIDVKLLQKTSFTQLSAIMFNPESVLQNFDIKLNTALNKGLIDGHPAGAMVASSPLFAQTGDDYQASIKLGAESEVNGEKVSFQELQGMIMSGMMGQ